MNGRALPSVDSSDLTQEQASKLNEQFGRMLAYINKLQTRMHALDLPPNDPLQQDLAKARDAVRTLFIKKHYLSCADQTANRPQAK